MRKIKALRNLFFALASLVLLVSAAAQDPSRFGGVEIFRDVLWLGNSVSDSAPSPILGVWGASAKFRVTNSLYFMPEIGLYGIEYFHRDGKSLPAEIEAPDAVGTLVVLLDPLLMYRFTPGNAKLSLLAGTGPALSLKIPLIPHGDAPRDEVAAYFYENLRFLYWEVKGALEWRITDFLEFTFRMRTLLPVFHLWDGEGSPFYDNLLAGAGIGVRLKF